ncbi:type IV toxin-antitoxin system AbiEi family antitoxin domain-containing protein [Myceligenerans salitolerans]|uniref:AbiEi antitoxin N-terminal domain-containing protein n=1 Tax=Myceligenerans salitolerans TaxID=1230528 RepID=A0ABS3IDA0_9MICO|nr:type IV toxin-antitoxin system AbiEi family antitoxin domain-containing protein [Myceligenerans salitolerans]MBO0610910.1 hypothetical protein [Myceligenerans salitolerans]
MTDPLRPAAAGQADLSRSGLYRAVRDGRFERIARGLYRAADAEPGEWEWIEAAARRQDATICLASALAYHDLTDTIPTVLDVALRRGARRPATDSAIAWHLFDTATFDVGRTTIPVPGSTLRIGLYDAQRSIVDAFRLRAATGYEIGRDALREWLRRGGKPAEILRTAQQIPRSTGPLRQALEALA